MLYYCIVCFYDSEMTGKFTVDFIFTDLKIASDTLKEYMEVIKTNEIQRCWPVLYIAKTTIITDETYYVYLDQTKKRLYTSLYEIPNSPFNSRKLLLPAVSSSMPDEYLF